MLLTTTNSVPERNVAAILGLVQGSTVRAKHVGRDLMAGLKMVIGGELKGYTEMLEDARTESTRRMKAEAKRIGADAVIEVRYNTTSVAGGAAEMLCYGTAVKLS
ncbi:MAG: YbjQ family protein [Planctomycetota bacterium]|nr:YbjQ family protein [Planctomycetota bacterium]